MQTRCSGEGGRRLLAACGPSWEGAHEQPCPLLQAHTRRQPLAAAVCTPRCPAAARGAGGTRASPPLGAHPPCACSVDWSPDGGSVASGGKDKVLKLWRR